TAPQGGFEMRSRFRAEIISLRVAAAIVSIAAVVGLGLPAGAASTRASSHRDTTAAIATPGSRPARIPQINPSTSAFEFPGMGPFEAGYFYTPGEPVIA